jgi:diguanylate cyclase (GGDEF)-like protein
MGDSCARRQDGGNGAAGNHFSCSMSSVLLAEVSELAGEGAVAEVLARANCRHSPEYLSDIANWISYQEAIALWRAGMDVTHNPQLPRLTGQRAALRLSSSPVATLLRSLGSPESVYRQVATSATKFSTVARLEAVETRPGYAELTAEGLPGFPRSVEHCGWTMGLLATTTLLFGLPPATVEHDQCAAYGAARCIYRVSWTASQPEADEQTVVLRQQLVGMQERLNSMFATASDLIAADDIGDVLARITDRAAFEVRAPRYLLAVRMEEDGELRIHHRGFDEQEAAAYAERVLNGDPSKQPKSWLVVPVRSTRRDYGRLLAAFDAEQRFFPQERELLEVYARYAASALDGAAALMEANRRYHQSSALLRLARALASAGTSQEVARRLADAVPLVVDCDRVGVYLWEPSRGELVRRAITTRDPSDPAAAAEQSWAPSPGGPLERLLDAPHQEPMFVDAETGAPQLRAALDQMREAAAIMVPLSSDDALLGLLAVSVLDRPDRLRPTPDLLDRLSGVAAQAATALMNGRLVDEITHQAHHDQLTGLANRLEFAGQLRKAIQRARQHGDPVTIFYLDLDAFKPVNDRYGHETGDRLLSCLGQRLAASVRASDVVARLGGDEFAVLISTQTSAEEADGLAARLRSVFAEPFIVGGQRLEVDASVGRAVFPEDADTAEGLLRHADAAMFEAKRRRRGALVA